MLSEDEKAKLRAAAVAEGVDPDALVAAAEESSSEPAEGGKGVADRLLIGFLDYVKVKELRERLGFTDRVAGDEELCTAFSIARGMKPDPNKVTAKTASEPDGEA